MPEAKISLFDGNAKSSRTLTAAADGSFDARGLQPGHYGLSASDPKRQLATESVTALDLKPGEIAHADLTLGLSTVHYGFWSRLVRRLVGLH